MLSTMPLLLKVTPVTMAISGKSNNSKHHLKAEHGGARGDKIVVDNFLLPCGAVLGEATQPDRPMPAEIE